MGTWGHGLFDDDLALDVKASFDRAVAGGARAAEAAAGLMESELAREVLEEFSEDDRDDTFWEESRGLFYAIASIQLEHGVLQEVVRQQTLQAIAVERRGLDPEQDRARWELLDALEAQLTRAGQAAEASAAAEASGAEAPRRHRLAEGTNPALHIGTMMAKAPKKKAGARKAATKKPATKKPATKKPATKKPATKKPARKPAKKPAAKKPPKKPVTKRSAAKKPTKRRRRPARRMA